MLRPERTWTRAWAVGDKMFATESEARAYVAWQRGELQRKNFIAFLRDVIGYGEEPHSEPPLEAVADAILKKFKLTLRK